MPNRVGDRHSAALRDTEQRETIDPRGIDHGFEIIDKMLKGDVGHLTVREAIAPRIVANERVFARQVTVEMPPDRTFQIELEMGHPVTGLDDRWTLADLGIGELHTITGLTEVYLLLGSNPSRRLRRS